MPILLLLLAGAAAAKPSAPADCADARLPLLLHELPLPAQQLLGRGEAGVGGLADRDEPFTATDAVFGPLRPMTRFVGAAAGERCLAVVLERGGIAHFVETAILREVDGRWGLVATRAPTEGEVAAWKTAAQAKR
ncbi:hypothetical protein [Pseudoduganella buxea]|uniref:Uncharacterized protein n=1 Tax=Pseudoduganella buxea TaxID=1949069 RepID=A0A6I3SR13_9BURK|nr:hypothetical protein [Pseudoduganella buxea]MTV51533.1 hypothetical protein [Pseudoduganella buxea]GGB89738.1 hypothetical protein GCM10011572_09820 [Pseudoduganella buxea]